MIQIPDARDIARALRTGYGYEGCGREPVYMTDDGDMYQDEAVEYMQDYCRTNTGDAARAFGIEVIQPE